MRVLASMFRSSLLRSLGHLLSKGMLRLGGYESEAAFRRVRGDLYGKAWVVYAKRPLSDASGLLRYFARYTHRIALSNQRLLGVDERGVRLATRGGCSILLSTLEFVRRFLQHVPPHGFVRVRHFGLFAASNAHKLSAARELLEGHTPATVIQEAEATEPEAVACPMCFFGRLKLREVEGASGNGRAPPS